MPQVDETPQHCRCVSHLLSRSLAVTTFGVLGIVWMIPTAISGKFFLIFSPVFISIFGLLMLAA